jgi:hypothetical protein
MNKAELVNIAKALMVDDKACWPWMKATKPVIGVLQNLGFLKPKIHGVTGVNLLQPHLA